MKKDRIILLIILLIVGSTCMCFAATETENQCADALYELGLFKGTGVKTDGSPEYSLDRVPNRAEAITMLVRLLGKETEAKSQEWKTPFNDVDAWARPYVGYAYNNGLTTGTSSTKFGSLDIATETQYLTFVLRALGYDDKAGDFKWDEATVLADEIGIQYGSDIFTRGSVVKTSFSSLDVLLKSSNITLADKLIQEKIISNDVYKEVSQQNIVGDIKLQLYSTSGSDGYYYEISGLNRSKLYSLYFRDENNVFKLDNYDINCDADGKYFGYANYKNITPEKTVYKIVWENEDDGFESVSFTVGTAALLKLDTESIYFTKDSNGRIWLNYVAKKPPEDAKWIRFLAEDTGLSLSRVTPGKLVDGHKSRFAVSGNKACVYKNIRAFYVNPNKDGVQLHYEGTLYVTDAEIIINQKSQISSAIAKFEYTGENTGKCSITGASPKSNVMVNVYDSKNHNIVTMAFSTDENGCADNIFEKFDYEEYIYYTIVELPNDAVISNNKRKVELSILTETEKRPCNLN